MKYEVGQVLLINNPTRLYKITDMDYMGYHATYVGPGTQTIDNALISITYYVAHKPNHCRLATPAEIVLYTK